MKISWDALCATFIVVTIFWGIFVWSNLHYGFQEPVEVCDTKTGYDYKENGYGGNITANVKYTLGEAGRITTSSSSSNSSGLTEYYYIIPVIFNGETYFICTEVSKEEKSTFDELYDGVDTSSIPIHGTFQELDAQMYDYMTESVQYYNSYYEIFENDKELEEHVLPVCLVPINYEYRYINVFILIALVVFDIISFIMAIITKKRTIANVTQLGNSNMNNYAQKNNHFPESPAPFDDATKQKSYHNTLDQFYKKK